MHTELLMNCHLKATHIALCPYLLLTHHSHHHCATGQRWLSVTYPHHSGHEWSLSALMDLTEIVIMLWLIKPYSGAPAGSVQAVFSPISQCEDVGMCFIYRDPLSNYMAAHVLSRLVRVSSFEHPDVPLCCIVFCHCFHDCSSHAPIWTHH